MGNVAREYQPIYWFDAPHPLKPIQVWWMDEEMYPSFRGEHPLGDEKVAYWCEETWRIILWAGLEKKYHSQVLLHELGHACWNDDQKLSRVSEEKALVSLQRMLSKSLEKQGWSLPPLPSGLRSLATHARWLRYGAKQRDNRPRGGD